jgi:hypothetical protein
MKLGMTSKLESQLPHVNHGAVHLSLRLLPTSAAIYSLHGRDISANDSVTPSRWTSLRYVANPWIYILRARTVPPLNHLLLVFSYYNPNYMVQ